MSERAYRAERADTEDRGEYAQMAGRRERDAHEAFGENDLYAESASRSQRMDEVENQQRLIRNTVKKNYYLMSLINPPLSKTKIDS